MDKLILRRTNIQGIVRGQQGQSLIEYALILALIAGICIGALATTGGTVSSAFQTIAGTLNSGSVGGGSGGGGSGSGGGSSGGGGSGGNGGWLGDTQLPAAAIYAETVSGGNISVNGAVYSATNISGNIQNGSLHQNTPGMTFPSFEASAFAGHDAPPTDGGTLNQSVYYVNGDWVIANSTGNVNFSTNSSVIIYVTGNVDIKASNVNFGGNGSVMIIAGNNITSANANNLNFGKAVLVAGQNVNLNVVSNLNGSIVAGGTVAIKTNGNINYDQSVVSGFNTMISSL
ncbi:MAG: hypothetical protein P4N59_02625 [Negativicutes bacterium]|nr:hypothetical protein [Negativicutes bacterium]